MHLNVMHRIKVIIAVERNEKERALYERMASGSRKSQQLAAAKYARSI